MLNLVADLNPVINGIVAPSLGLFIIPRFLRARTTGEYIGFTEFALLPIFVGWAILKALAIFPEFGVTWEAVIRTSFTTCVPFVGAFIWVKLTDHFGWEKSHQIRQ